MMILFTSLLLIAACAAGFAAVVRAGMRTNADLLNLQRQHDELKVTLNEFMTESGKIAGELSRAIMGRGRPAEAPAEPPTDRKPASKIDERYHVLQLARQGKSVDEISGKLKIPSGEVELILNLYRGSTAGRVGVH
jgi:DNA-binding NarL/FixJ family response regulator